MCKVHLLTLSTEQVSKLLEKHMGSAYAPGIHWTSRLRGRAGLTPYEVNDKTQSTFTIDDLSGSFTELLIRNGYKSAISWRKRVVTTLKSTRPKLGLIHRFVWIPAKLRRSVLFLIRYMCWNCHIPGAIFFNVFWLIGPVIDD